MATNKNPLKGLHKVKAKGKTYCYAWRGGPKIVAEPGTREFLEEFVAARSPHIDGSRFAGWVQKYQASEDYKGISDKTKSNWGPILDEIRDHFGALPVRLWSNPKIRHDIRVWRDKWRGTPRASDVRKTVLSRVCSFMVANGELMVNPCIGIENLYTSDRSEIIWTEADLAALLAAASQEIGWIAQYYTSRTMTSLSATRPIRHKRRNRVKVPRCRARLIRLNGLRRQRNPQSGFGWRRAC